MVVTFTVSIWLTALLADSIATPVVALREATERVLRDGTDLAGEEVELSLLFMDIRGFTTYSESASAPAVVAIKELYGRLSR